ncbi:pyridoxamine 5'-phosphate oxidase family protein [Pseudonocardia sp. N23]|uniref:pyridoxamine 5'-phosphate oxidase family protein n=1 Tax=Pseudonocardia sp. N23 TaxID=1987376 RepID=UPI000C032ABC|nr:pyridoxamine 5'-phosphate oxidase family protein [Pseudonocardia sp. N23]GAY07289.1 pyridoxamine 5'-phosphate oxidase [Pseudonocardia sp. N23]
MTGIDSTPLSSTTRTTLGRYPDRARTDRRDLHAVLDAGVVCHLGTVVDGAPLVLPTSFGRIGDTLYLHGSSGATSLRAAAEGAPVCVTVTHVDGIVYARSVFSHSVNYRCAVIHGVALRVEDEGQKLAGLRALADHMAPGSWEHARGPTTKELAATVLLSLDMVEASVKVRTGPPGDDEEDIASARCWAGVVPIVTNWGAPQRCPRLPDDILVPDHVAHRYSARS